jgi:hypothetical protein
VVRSVTARTAIFRMIFSHLLDLSLRFSIHVTSPLVLECCDFRATEIDATIASTRLRPSSTEGEGYTAIPS